MSIDRFLLQAENFFIFFPKTRFLTLLAKTQSHVTFPVLQINTI